MQEFVYFLGRLHVLALHLPIGIVVAAVALDFVARTERFRVLAPAAPFLWGAAALSALLTVVLGYMHFAEGGFAGPSGNAHRLFGTLTAVVTLIAWWLAARRIPVVAPRLVVGAAALLLVTVTGHFGGNLTHGSTFLVEHAPGPIRALFGAEGKRPKPTSVAEAEPYLDVVQPLLNQRCGTCHGGDKHKGSFSIATYESTLAGGDTRRAVVPGDLKASELYFRITLPPADDKHMPAEGKTPLTVNETEIVRWWITQGAPHAKPVRELVVDASITPLLQGALGLGAKAESSSPLSSAAAVTADAALVDELGSVGFTVRQISQSDPRLIVAVSAPGMRLGDEHLAALTHAAKQIVELNLQNANVDDKFIRGIGPLTELVKLRVSNNAISDQGLTDLASLQHLEHLNLYGNPRVTDTSVDSLARLAALKRLDVWQTGVTAAGIARLHKTRPERVIQGAAALQLREPQASQNAPPR